MTIKNITIKSLSILTLLMCHSYIWNMEETYLKDLIHTYERVLLASKDGISIMDAQKNICHEMIPYFNFDLEKVTKEYNARQCNAQQYIIAPHFYSNNLLKFIKKDNARQHNRNHRLLTLPN